MIRKSQGTDPGHEGHDLLRRPARAAQLPLWQRLLVLRVRDRRADRALFLSLHRFVKFLELLLFARQVFGEGGVIKVCDVGMDRFHQRSEEHTSELQSLRHLVCRLLLEKKKKNKI